MAGVAKYKTHKQKPHFVFAFTFLIEYKGSGREISIKITINVYPSALFDSVMHAK